MQYRTLPRHLVVRHHVHNPQEHNILLQMAHGRINIRTEPCTVVGCGYHGTRLDRHINCDHPELSQEEADLLMKSVKHSTGLKLLRELREVDPPTQMITTLDVDYAANVEHPDCFPGEVDLEVDEHRQLRLANVALVAQNDSLEKEVHTLRRKMKQWKAASVKKDLRKSLESPPAEIIPLQQPETSASSGKRASVNTGKRTPTPLVESSERQSRDAGDEDSRGERLRRPMSAPPSVNILESSEASWRRDTKPSTSGVKCKKKRKHTSQEHGVVSKTARDEGQGRVGTRRISATPRPTSRSSPVATCRYTPGLLEAMKDTAVKWQTMMGGRGTGRNRSTGMRGPWLKLMCRRWRKKSRSSSWGVR